MSSMGVSWVSTVAANTPEFRMAWVVRLSLWMASITLGGSAVTWVRVFTTQPAAPSPSLELMM